MYGSNILPVFLYLFFSVFIGKEAPALLMEEICDNAIDDDGDGLIDLNDPDCNCPIAEPFSLIPNPSFEEHSCCPTSFSELHCADDWIQASEATTDYLNTCGWMGWDGLPVPLPLPDGQACVGFRDGRYRDDEQRPGWKEYAGACLRGPLRAGRAYRFEFNVGFINGINSPATNIVFFGSTDCENLPFGIGDPDFGCPTNGPGWKRLGSIFLSGYNTWLKGKIDIVPTEDIYAIAIGPDCPDRVSDVDLYYFFDNLVLDEQSAFEFQINSLGNPCTDDFFLEVPRYDTLTYQWYRNGIALLGETGPKLQVKTGEGRYEARLLGPSSCRLTHPYFHSLPREHEQLVRQICPGEGFRFGAHHLTEPGIYTDTLKSAEHCDSIVQLTLKVEAEFTDTVQARIFPGEQYRIGPYKFSRLGMHRANLQTDHGCDSLVYVDLDFYEVYFPNAFSPNGDGVNDSFTVFGGVELRGISSLQVFDRWGGLVYSGKDLAPNDESAGWNGESNGRLAQEGVYVYRAILVMDDGEERQRSGAVMLVR